MPLQTCHSERKLPTDHHDLLLRHGHPALKFASFFEVNTATPDYASTPMTRRVPGPADFLVCGSNKVLAFLASGKAPLYSHKDKTYHGTKSIPSGLKTQERINRIQSVY